MTVHKNFNLPPQNIIFMRGRGGELLKYTTYVLPFNDIIIPQITFLFLQSYKIAKYKYFQQ